MLALPADAVAPVSNTLTPMHHTTILHSPSLARHGLPGQLSFDTKSTADTTAVSDSTHVASSG